jgi:uncharacterized membrane-anchored protein YhcB (DUF1043 family)
VGADILRAHRRGDFAMKELLFELVNRLEQQDLRMLTLTEHLDALQATFDFYHLEAGEDYQRFFAEARQVADSLRDLYESLYEGYRQSISKLPD